MLKNYLLIALRNLNRQKVYSFLNILGLTIGITCSLLLFLFIFDELSFDKFHPKVDRIYRVTNYTSIQETQFESVVTPAPLAPTLLWEFPEIEKAIRIASAGRQLVSLDDRKFYESGFFFTDSTFFDVFGFNMLMGDPKTALIEPNSMVITQSIADKYFANENPVGKSIRTGSEEVLRTITGVMEDPPSNSHFRPKALIAYSTLSENRTSQWGSFNDWTYLLIKEGTDPHQLEAKFPLIFDKYMAELFSKFNAKTRYGLENVRDIHLKSKLEGDLHKGGDIAYLYIFGAIAFFLLIIASINYMNLSTARAEKRAREVGIRKALGSYKAQLIGQFLAESVLLTFIAVFLSIWLAQWLLPVFNSISGKEIDTLIFTNINLLLCLLGIILFVGFIGGSYPALYLSRFQPAAVLKGNVTRGQGGKTFRKVLVVFQFAISIIMVASTIIVYQQLNYATTKDLGYQVNNRITVPLSGQNALSKFEVIRTALLRNPAIKQVGSGQTAPGDSDYNRNGILVENAEGAMKEFVLVQTDIDDNYFDALGMELVEGRNFSRDIPSDTSSAVIVNQALVKMMGWDHGLDKKLGRIVSNELDTEEARVVGVVKDFHQFSLHQPIEPMFMTYNPRNNSMIISMESGNPKETLTFIENTFREILPDRPFEYRFLVDDFEKMYEDDIKKGYVFTAFSLTTILIACLGLFGLASYTAEQKKREIGIRKVIGAEISHIMGLVMKDFVILVIVAVIISWPLTYFLMKNWLQNFAYSIEMNWISFVVSALIGLMVTLITVGYHSLKAAVGNPVNALKVE